MRLTAIISAIGADVGLGTSNANSAARNVTSNSTTVTIVGAVASAVILFVVCCCGGHITGRMVRFGGAEQRLAVWMWAVVTAIVVARVGFGR